MNRQHKFYPVDRAFPTFFVSFLLGNVWGFTAVSVLGIVALVASWGEIPWHLLSGATLAASLYLVYKVAGRTPEGSDAQEMEWVRVDAKFSVFSFAVAYVAMWILIRVVATSIVI